MKEDISVLSITVSNLTFFSFKAAIFSGISVLVTTESFSSISKSFKPSASVTQERTLYGNLYALAVDAIIVFVSSLVFLT